MSNETPQPESGIRKAGGWLPAALAIACGQTGAAASAAGGVSISSLRRWARRDSFKRLVDELRGQMLSATLGRLIAANMAAIDCLTALLRDPQGSVQLGAASRLLELTLKARKQLDIEKDIEFMRGALEEIRAQQAADGSGGGRAAN